MKVLQKAISSPIEHHAGKFDVDTYYDDFITVYICYRGFDSGYQKTYFEYSQAKPVFLNKYDAFRFSRFMSDGADVVQLYVHESAIVGHNNVLSLKPQAVGQANVMGHFSSLEQDEQFCKNPQFDATAFLEA